MRYSRALTVLALIGVVALTASLLTHSGRSVPRHVRGAVTRPALQSMLHQQLQLLLTSHRRPSPTAPSLSVPFNSGSCFVASGPCSETPCVIFVQGGSQPAVSESVQNNLTIPTLPRGPGSQGCTRHASPQTLRVSSQSQPLALPAGAPVVTRRPTR